MISGNAKIKKIVYFLFLVILVFYPLRHIWLGVEVTDGAYSAGNYRFLDHINPMWLFSTYLANVTGQFLTGLPGGDTLMGLNFYSALFISVIAATVYLFFTRVVHMDSVTAFLGELLAVSLCWCPTTILYNYMTYFFFNAAIMVLYLGLVKEKRALLFGAGILLGINVLVRFPNLTEASLILSLWYYGVLQRKRLKDVLQETGICLLGYLAGAGIALCHAAVAYGLSEYVAGIIRLMQMPSEASDYSAVSMVLTVLLDYKFSSKWLIHMAVLAAAGTLVSAVFLGMRNRLGGAGRQGRVCGGGKTFGAEGACVQEEGQDSGGESALFRVICLFGKAVFLGLILVLFCWWYKLGVFNIKYYTYESMFQWTAIFLILVIAAGIYVLFSKRCTRNEKLLASMVLILIAMTPLGSNNHLYPNMNNMFLVFPFGLSLLGRLLRSMYEAGRLAVGEKEAEISLFPLRAVLAAFLGVMCLQCLLFGAVFTFRDGMSGQKRDTKIEKNAILKGMVTNAPLAKALEELTAYVEEKHLSDRNVILYGQIPGISYMLDMQPAISTSWPDLASYHYEVMVEDMQKLREQTTETGRPLIILGCGMEKWISGGEMTEAELVTYKIDDKWFLIYDYMTELGYEKTFQNEMFVVYE